MSIVIQLKPQWNKIHLCLEYLRNVFMLLDKGFSKGGLSFWKIFKSQWWLVSPPLLRMSRFSSLLSQCLLRDKNPFKFLSTCPSFYLPASDMHVYFPDWLHILFPANGLFAATGGSTTLHSDSEKCLKKYLFIPRVFSVPGAVLSLGLHGTSHSK